jgi:hypothetical protein
MSNKQSSIEWLIEQFQLHGYLGLYTEEEHIEKHKAIFEGIVYQAKAMHRTEIIESYASGSNDRLKNTINTNYYNETFNNNEN